METESHNREDTYDQMMTRLFDAIKTEANLCTLPPGCSLLAELDQVKERYMESSYIAGGGMKKIYKVTDKMTDRPVAMAVMHTLKSPEVVEQFIHEARINARLEHPNIMPVYDIGLDELGEPFFTMKLVSGDNLGKILKKLDQNDLDYTSHYDLSRLLNIFTKVCDAVGYAHSRGVLHLDLKPENIQIGSYGEVLVCDWGLSRYHEISLENIEVRDAAGSLLMNSGNICGTPGFMAPEQITGERKHLDAKSDIYSLGSILYSILTLTTPFNTKDVEEILSATVAGKFPKPTKRTPKRTIPSALEAVCQRAMAVKPENRYDTAGELKEDIFAYIQGYATSAENAGFLRMVLLLIKRHSTISLFIAGALATIASQTTFFVLELKKEKEKAERQRFVALANESEARKNLEKYEKEHKEKQQLGEAVTPELTNKVVKELDELDFSKAWQSMRRAIKVNPEGNLLNKLRGCMLLGDHRFQEALPYFEKNSELNAKIYTPLLKAFAKSTRKGGKLSHDGIAALTAQLHKDNLTFATVAFLRNCRPSFDTLDQRVEFTKRLLLMVNPQMKTLNFEYKNRPDGKLWVNLSKNKELKEISVVMLLVIHELDLSDTGVDNITVLGQLPLERLDLTRTNVEYLTSLSSCFLRTLNISQTQVKDISPLSNLPLEHVWMENTSLSDFHSLSTLKRLKVMTVSYSESNLIHLREARIPDRIRILLK